MSERTSYPPGVPCWVTVLQSDPAAARDFYGPLFGWEFEGAPDDADAPYFLARKGGAEVAAIGSLPDGTQPAWITEVCVADADAAGRAAEDAGGRLLSPVLDFPPAGRLAVLADPAGAVLCGWEPAGRRGAERVNEPSAWSMSSLRTPDPDGAAAFYGRVFGWETESFGPASMFRLPGFVGGEPEQPVPRDVVAVMEPAEGATPEWAVDFWTDDADGAAETARRLGGSVVVEPHDRDEIPFRYAVLADPEGAEFSVSQLLMPPG